ncbi:hypothetical protein BV25DRAFT_1828948 [Artomyces pyxidatus]|uniref:Uncharacterized protein n=1 Tax=Artomyces pyxidatus TaxID=48021 RepID=A0ACB8STI5_9AGAM|nr:hypothetical protein BV25DRAFT_1828948 [Artomyces pyxidatus]
MLSNGKKATALASTLPLFDIASLGKARLTEPGILQGQGCDEKDEGSDKCNCSHVRGPSPHIQMAAACPIQTFSRAFRFVRAALRRGQTRERTG